MRSHIIGDAPEINVDIFMLQATPDQVKATTDMASVVAMKDFLQYKTDDVITVLDNK